MNQITREDANVRLAALQHEIREYLGLSSDHLIFDFIPQEGKMRLDLITINPRHNQSFLFHSLTGSDKLDVAEKMLDYIRNYRDKENSYTIQWKVKGDSELQTSYFHANNIYQALDKLYFGRDVNSITVFSVVLNPVS